MPSKPTILFVHGAWHQPGHFVPITKVFESAGYEVVTPQLPSYNAFPAKDFEMYTDADLIRSETQKLVDQGKDVVLVLHSYGGIVGSQAADQALGKRAREAEGKKGGIARLVYMCAFMLKPGDHLYSSFGGEVPSFIKVEVIALLPMKR